MLNYRGTMPAQEAARFLNVDLLIAGRFDSEPLLQALGDRVFALHEDAELEGKKCLVLEVTAPDLGVPETVMRLVRWVERLPPAARRSWSRASIRRFDIGIQGGLRPHETHWVLPSRVVAAIADIGADVAITVYGAKMHRKPRRRSTPK
jgi:hypothetical protein